MTVLRTVFLMAALAVGLAAGPVRAADTVVRYWYHLDDPKQSLDGLVAKFEKENPGIKIQAEMIPWGGGADYAQRLFTAVIGNAAPDAAQVKLANLSRLMEMDALEPLDPWLEKWAGKADIAPELWDINRASDGKQYYLPLQYVVLYLYYRTDWFKDAGLQPPTNFDEFLAAAKALTKAPDRFGFGMRGGAGGTDNWGPFVLGGGASFNPGGMVTPKALAANRWYADLFKTEKVVPPSAPNDGFRQILDNFKAGRVAMIIHHIGSANELVGALGDKVSAVPVPHAPDGGAWTSFGDESDAIFASSKVKDAAFKWIAFLSTAENNVALCKLTGQLTVSASAAQHWTMHPQRFVDASVASLPFAKPYPDVPQTADFLRTVWPTNMQRALLGQISPDDMMKAIDKLYSGS